ncbi:MAG: NAD-dependent epimerase/dehydratase family protein [Deltaproteobacteria bacterium]|nr:NAD-dependent epimerase/dehydratase family protein [Deltaproteobacteria bacterium]MBW2413403.1 NAD-dependent epimerase/dehydratase family protein [Deltaproteobacteria bacterium]
MASAAEGRGVPRRVAITGLDTFAGLHTAERLLDWPQPPEIVGIDLRSPRRLEGRVGLHRVDLTEPTADSQVAEILEKERCDTLLHAGFLSHSHSDRSYAHELEVIGTLHVMNAAASAGVRKLVVLSTAEVYGPSPYNPGYLTESCELRPHPDSHMARDRAEMEQLLGLFADRHPQVVVTVLRPCWVIGPTIDSRVLRHFESARVTTLLGYDPLLQWLHESDLLDAIERVLRRDARGPYNLAGAGALPVSTLLRLAGKRARRVPHSVLQRLGYAGTLWSDGDAPAGFYDYLRFPWLVDVTRAREELGFEPEYSTKEAWMSFVVSRRLRRYR